MTTHRLIAAAGVALALGACTTARPPAAVSAQLPPGWHAPAPHNGRLQDLRAWWQQFGDPLLVELVEAAQNVSPTVGSARSRIVLAHANRVAAGAVLLPTLDGSVTAARGNAQPPTPMASTVQAGLLAAWEIDLFGGNRAAADAAQARLEGAQAGWHDARVSVAAETALSYLGYRTCERLLAVAANDAASRAETARLTELSARAGFTAPADAALARASAAEGSGRLTQQRARCDFEVKNLVALSAMPEALLRQKLQAAWTEPGLQANLAVSSVAAEVLLQRPDVYQAEREVAAASADVGDADAQRYPRLTLAGSIGVASVRALGVSTTLDTWSIGPAALTVPLFDGGQRAANLEAAQARYVEATTTYTARVRQAVREVEQALINLDSARARNDDANTAAEGFAAAFNGAETRFRTGLASVLDLELNRRALLTAQVELVALQQERLAAWIALYRALGGGWSRGDIAAAPPS